MKHAAQFAASGNAAGDASAEGELIVQAAERIRARGRQERLWLEGWHEDYAAATDAGDEESCGLLLDVLIAFDAFQGTKRPTRLRPVA